MTVEQFQRAETIMQEMNDLEEIQAMIHGNGLRFCRKYEGEVKISPQINPYMIHLISVMVEKRLEKLRDEFGSL